ncbi:unnamed protein product [Paramecium pentaurelia]|uniref:Transmembrane protein n=1 Tax=Paramecium pentaurelia TaxID=43138 RepID=A0A8S1TBL5_9CILI|nr:unnamed protein product [Paramecium pentaurelia]
MNFDTNIYKSSLMSKWILILLLVICASLVAVFTGIAEVSPQILTFTDVVDDTKCQNELNIQQIQGTQEEFKSVLNNNLLCFFCHENIPDQPFGIKGILLNQENIVTQTMLTYSIGYFDDITKRPCWYDASQNENINHLPKIKSTIYDKQIEVQQSTILLNWECVKNITSYTCYTKEHIYKDNRSFSRLFGFVMIEGIQYQYMNFAIMKQSKDYYLYNEVMMIAWIGIELVFCCILFMLEDEFEEQQAKVLIPTLSVRNQIFLIFFLNNHPLFLIQLFYDNLYLKLFNVIFQSIGQAGFMFYCISITFKLLGLNQQFIAIINSGICVTYSALKSFITIVTGLDMMKNIPQSSVYLNQSNFTFIGLFMVFWYTYFIVVQGVLFIKNRQNKAIQYKYARTDINMKLCHKYFKGIFIFQIFSLIFISAFFARILWQNIVIFNPNYLYYDHYQITLINVWVVSLFILFHLENPNKINQILEVDEEEISDKVEIQLCNTIQLEEEQVKLQEIPEQNLEMGSKTLDTNLRKVKYNDIAQPETQLRH